MALSSQEKREQLRRLLEREHHHSPPRFYPLSFGQERIWLDQQVNAGSSLHHVIGAARVKGPLDTTLLARSLNEVIKRHESLRATFVEVDHRPRQMVAPTLTITPRLVDLGGLPEAERPAEAERRAREEGRVPFDLARGPLLRLLLLRLAETDHLMVLTLHHIIIDGWSAKLLAGELWQFYGALSSFTVPALPALPIQYGDFVTWQRAHFAGGAAERDLAYWKERLHGPLPTLELPLDRPRGPAVVAPCASRAFEIPADVQAGLHRLAGEEGATIFMVLLAAYQGLLSLYADEEDLLVGSPTTGRDRPETELLVGLFINIVLLRTDLSGQPTFRETLRRVRQTCLGAFAHQELPAEMLLDTLVWQRSAHGGGPSPVRALFNLVEEPSAESWRRSALTIAPIDLWPEHTDLDLNLHLRRRGSELSGALLYRQDVFEGESIDQLVADFLSMLRAAVADPDRPLDALGISEEARQRLRWKRYRAHRRASLDRLDDVERLSNLTKRQLLVWAGHKLRPTAPLYTLAATLTIEGPVDPACFARAFQTLLDSSDALRTVIEERDGVPWQRVLPPFPYPMSHEDFSTHPDPEAALTAWVTERAGRPFDLAGRLFEVALVKLAPRKYVCVFMQDHIVTDGWSIWLAFRHLAGLYEQALAGALPEKLALPPYEAWRDHERAYRASPRYARDRSYWAAKLADPSDAPLFYGSGARRRTTRGTRLSCALGAERSRRLLDLAGAQGAALGGRHAFLFSAFAGAFCAFLHHVAGVRRLTFVTYVHNRRTRAFKETLGLFLEIVPLRVEIDEETTFEEIVSRVRSEMLEGLRHAQHPISHVLHRAEVELNYHTISNETHRTVAGSAVHSAVTHTGHQEESLGVRILDFENSGNFTVDFDLHEDVFPEERRPRVVQHFLRALDELLADPGRPIGRISLVTPEERDRLLIGFNRTEASFPLERTFADLFEAQARRTPDRTAAVGDGQTLTYGELDGRANALAHRLQALGVGPDALVAIYLERSVDALISLLAVTKAGGAWIPLDPAYPTERTEAILGDARPLVVISRRGLLDRLRSLAAPSIDLDREGGGGEAAAPTRASGPRDLAYVIYTSGSTGAPKGAMIEQRGMLNHLLAKVDDLRLTEVDAVAQTASLAFDISVWQCFAALLVGGQVSVIPDEEAHDPRRLLAVVQDGGVSVLEVVPSLLRAMNELLVEMGADRPALPALRWLIATGEELSPVLCRQWLSLYPSIPLLNAYGPTECSDDVTHQVIAAPPPSTLARVPIGRPIANTSLYVLNRALQPLPLGVPGELCVGGIGVGRGYLGDPRRTEEVFVPDPFSPAPGARLYRTGDRARFLPDGRLEFLGRLDQQVKIRGHRVEPGEIESLLARHPAIAECVVTPRPHSRGELRLVAYVVPRLAGTIDAAHLREFLRARVPEAMIPAAFVSLDALPLTTNGKVDRRALPEPPRDQPGDRAPSVPPRSDTERRLVEIWEETFDVRPIGVTESFFDLGGHSLMALRMVGRIRATFGEELALTTLLTEPTIEALARRLERGPSSESSGPLVAIQPEGTRMPLFCVHPSSGSVMDYHRLAHHLGAEQPFFGLEARGLEGEAEPLTRVEDMARSYIAALRQARPAGPYALAGHSFGGIVAFEMARQLLDEGQPVALVALIDAWATPMPGEPGAEDRGALLSGVGDALGLPLGEIDVAWDHFWRLAPPEQVAYALDVAVAAGALPPEVSLAQLRRLLTLHLVNIDAMRRYVARPISCPLVVLRASEELSVTSRDGALGWNAMTTGSVEVLTVPGNHFSMLREPHVRIAAARLRGCLEAARRAGA